MSVDDEREGDERRRSGSDEEPDGSVRCPCPTDDVWCRLLDHLLMPRSDNGVSD